MDDNAVVEHGIEIVNMKGDIMELKDCIKEMQKTATRIYIAVLGIALSVLGNIVAMYLKAGV